MYSCMETGEFGVRGETLGPPNPGRESSALEMKLWDRRTPRKPPDLLAFKWRAP